MFNKSLFITLSTLSIYFQNTLMRDKAPTTSESSLMTMMIGRKMFTTTTTIAATEVSHRLAIDQ